MLSLSFSVTSAAFPPRSPAISSRAATLARPKPLNLYVNSNRMATLSLYEILGIAMGATNQEIKSAYRRLAMTCHPDVAGEDTSADEFMRIHAAYCTLSDPEKRAVYDGTLFRRARRPLTSGFAAYTGRNWETDQCW